MANIYILTGSFEDVSDAWVQFVSSSNKTELILGESGSEELISSVVTVPPILTQEEVDIIDSDTISVTPLIASTAKSAG